jgi:hypothetical protein
VDRVVKNWGKAEISGVIGSFSPFCQNNRQFERLVIISGRTTFLSLETHFISVTSQILLDRMAYFSMAQVG